MKVVYEDNHIIIVSKQSGEIVQGDKTGDSPLSDFVKQYLKEKYHKPGDVFLGVVHRLDRPVSGLVVFARTSKALTRLNKMFAEGKVHKTYWAIVERRKSADNSLTVNACRTFANAGNAFDKSGYALDNAGNAFDKSGYALDKAGNAFEKASNALAFAGSSAEWHRLEHWIVRNEKQNKSFAYAQEKPNSKKAILEYRLLKAGDNYDLMEVRLMTGRHHQIRCQLAAAGMPIRGDLKYGARRSNPDGSISLLSRRIAFIHPVSGAEISVESPLPDDPIWGKIK